MKRLMQMLAVGLVCGTVAVLAQTKIATMTSKTGWVKCVVTQDPYKHPLLVHPDYATIFGLTNGQTITWEQYNNIIEPIRLQPTWKEEVVAPK